MAPLSPAPETLGAATARGEHAMVVSSHPLATRQAVAALERGGSLADAAIAGGAVLTVVAQHATSLCGDAIVLVHEAAGRTRCLNGTGRSPAGLRPEAYADGIPWQGALTVTSPGLPAAWQALHRSDGRLAWPELFAEASRLARDGFAVSPKLADDVAHYADGLRRDAGASDLFLPEGQPLAAGRTLRQPALAACLDEIAAGGADAFYRGQAARSIADTVRRLGGFLAFEDFAGCEARWVAPLSTTYRGHQVTVPPPNSYALMLLLQLDALAAEPFPRLAGLDPARFLRLVAAAQAAFAHGRPYVADPAFVPDPSGALAPSARQALQDDYRRRIGAIGPLPDGGTATISVMDRDGNAVVVLQSVMQEFGSFTVDPGTGILLNNRMCGFGTTPGEPNALAPGKRVAHTLSPSLVLRDGRIRYVLGTPGGPGQTATLAQAVNALLDLRQPLDQAIGQPRWGLGRAGRVMIEPGMPAAVADHLRRHGIAAEVPPQRVPYFGSIEAIEVGADGLLSGVVDHRCEAAALGL